MQHTQDEQSWACSMCVTSTKQHAVPSVMPDAPGQQQAEELLLGDNQRKAAGNISFYMVRLYSEVTAVVAQLHDARSAVVAARRCMLGCFVQWQRIAPHQQHVHQQQCCVYNVFSKGCGRSHVEHDAA